MTDLSSSSTPTMTDSTRRQLILDAERLAKDHMEKYDPSHDWFHVNRVRNTAMRLSRDLQARGETEIDDLLVELVALFHDMAAKYATTNTLASTLDPFLSATLTTSHLQSSQIENILEIIPFVSWSTEKKLRQAGEWEKIESDLRAKGIWDVLCCVQDADRLDAIGAFGIMRVSAYSSAVNRPLHVPRPHTDIGTSQPDDKIDALRATSSIQHFHDKLLLIKDRLKTPMGKREGLKRHQTMITFLSAIDDELDEEA